MRRLLYAALLFTALSSARAAELFDETKTTTLFAFDTVSLPHSQNLRLEMRAPKRHPANPVVRRGEPGTPDAMGVQFYGSVIREGGRFRMWYVAFDDDVESRVQTLRWRAAYAESDDGLVWKKPNLGLVTFRGSKDNNLVLTEPGPFGFVNVKVLADPADPDPARRYKIATHVYYRQQRRLGTLAPFASADGLTWKLLIDAQPLRGELRKEDLVLPAIHFEPAGGLYRWDGRYVICGQNAMNAPRPYKGRVTRVYESPDFVHWSQTSAVAFVRGPQHGSLGPGRSLEGEQTHEGISVWNRGNVLLGIVGQWHGAKEWKDVAVDLGFVMSNDGLHFREPAHEWTFLRRGADGEWDEGGLLQGQGFENVGDETFIYYGAWDPRPRDRPGPRGGVGVAVVPRDRFGDLVVETAGKGRGDYQLPEITSEFITAPLPSGSRTQRLHVNADGLGEEASLRIELFGADLRPLASYSGEKAAVVRTSGFQTPVEWPGMNAARDLPERYRVKVTFLGKECTRIRFSALYITPE